jgi:hypothetical protein
LKRADEAKELLSTVHWVTTRMGAGSLEEVVNKTYEWNERKRQFSLGQIKLALTVLSDKGWITNPLAT